MLWRLHPKHFSTLLSVENLSKQAAVAKSFINTEFCTISVSAPQWWQEKQLECFEQLAIERDQAIELCDALLQDLATLPVYASAATSSSQGNLSPRARNAVVINNFILGVQNLSKSLSAHKMDAINGTLKLIELVINYRSKLIENDNKGYLKQINLFFNLPVNSNNSEITEEIKKRLMSSNANEPECTTSSSRVMTRRAA